ncbi:hypothetical protein [Methanococcoides sp. AM1]|uniref:hypothetical protein n=1 Tax=Methanococcoides sp. AM1 TaxID=1201011 RepID=UPI0010824130|nr:hypothetical protein [Methanococcoides sp. AM1]
MDMQPNPGQIVRVDIIRDYSWAKMISLLMIAYFFLILGIFIDIFEILGYITWYLVIMALFLWDRTTVEVTNDMIKIHRSLFGSTILNKQDIAETLIKSNYNFAVRCILYLIMVLTLGYLFYGTFSDIQEYQMQNAPLEGLILLIVSKFMLISMFSVLSFSLERRLKHSTLLKVNTKDQSFVFYPDKPDEFEKVVTDCS